MGAQDRNPTFGLTQTRVLAADWERHKTEMDGVRERMKYEKIRRNFRRNEPVGNEGVLLLCVCVCGLLEEVFELCRPGQPI